MKKIVLIVLCFCVISLAGCSRHDEVYYLHHPDSLKIILDNCVRVKPINKAQREECLVSMKIYEKLSGLSQTMMANPQGFGKEIIALQIQQSKLKSQIDAINSRLTAKTLSSEQTSVLFDKLNTLKKTFAANQHELKIRLALVAAAEGM